MKKAGLDQVRRLGPNKWQAIVVNTSDEKVFVHGPYPSQAAAVAAAGDISAGDVGYQGGDYVAYGAKALVGNSSLLAACLEAAAHHAFGF